MNFELPHLKNENNSGFVYLIPSALGEGGEDFYSLPVKEKIFEIEFFMVENERSARRFLRSIGYKKNFDEVTIVKVENDNDFSADEKLNAHLTQGKNLGVISEAGSPGIADPGAAIVRWAHSKHRAQRKSPIARSTGDSWCGAHPAR